jgi:hypothetical protein
MANAKTRMSLMTSPEGAVSLDRLASYESRSNPAQHFRDVTRT